MLNSLIGGIAGSIGQLFTSHNSAENQSALQYKYQTKLNKSNFKYNKALIDYQNKYNTEMFNRSVDLVNTAHQRQVADLRAAGLNPILSANNGAGSVNPVSSGNSQLSSSAGMPSEMPPDLMSAMQTASGISNEFKRVGNELKNSAVNRSYTRAQESNIYNQMEINNKNSASEIAKRQAEIQEIKNRIKNDNFITKAQVSKMASDIKHNESSARSLDANTSKVRNDIEHYAVDRGFHIGGTKIGLGFHWTSHPNEKNKSRGGSIDSTHPKGLHYETINGHRVQVRSY